MQLTARDIAGTVGGKLSGNPDEIVTGVAGIKEAQPGDLTFVGSPKYFSALKTTRASVVILASNAKVASDRTLIRVDNPLRAFATAVEHIVPPPIRFKPGVHPSAAIAPTAKLGKDVSIQPFVVIEDDAVVGDRTVVGAGSYVGNESQVGDDCIIYPRVTMRERTKLGDRVILHGGVVLGADGFGYEFTDGKHQKIPQVGTVEIGDDVEIGANTTIDRARFGKTRIGRGTKIDNLVQIGHNCVIGEHCIICGLVGMAGSTIIGDYVTIAGQVGIAGHLTIGDKSIIMAQAGVTKDVPPGSFMLGAPAVPHTKFKRVNAATQRLPEFVDKLRELEEQLAEMRARLR
ncbi:MAG TPA: UDP-3-O-(3-hydroxymyristoyl)glucosamine N-acyltransferase [Verrucomicrobiae bacterium]|nr:UDP-3-O-(3-hydroxymyristoyl)glucosamine N-acyltransferase [Verrucomicrobiae bacterium]